MTTSGIEGVKTTGSVRDEPRLRDPEAGFIFLLPSGRFPRGSGKEADMRGFWIPVLAAALAAGSLPAGGAEPVEEETKETREEENDDAVALGDYLVTATRTPTPLEEIASGATLLGEEDLETAQWRTVSDALRSVPGLDVVRTGGPGTSTSVFIRGAKSEHTLVLVDGIEMNDPTNPTRGYDFDFLDTALIERIEVIRGPQSVLYGSDSIGGVVQIITRRGEGPPRISLSAEGGCFETFRVRSAVHGGAGVFDYALGASAFSTRGISAADADDGNTEPDGAWSLSLSGRAGFAPEGPVKGSVVFRAIRAGNDADVMGGPGGDDPDFTIAWNQGFVRPSLSCTLFDGAWEQTLSFGVSHHTRRSRNREDPDHPGERIKDYYAGTILDLEWQNDLKLHENDTLTVGLDVEEESGYFRYFSDSLWGPYMDRMQPRSALTAGLYLQNRLALADRFFFTAGARADHHDRFGTACTGRVTGAYRHLETGTKLRVTLGSGFKAPSLYQLYSQYGDTDLEPERSLGWEIGLDQAFGKGAFVLGAAFFRNEFENLIDFDSATSTYNNVARARSFGVETVASAAIERVAQVTLQYTWMDTEDLEADAPLLRRAENKLAVDVGVFPAETVALHVSVRFTGTREDFDFSAWPARRVELEPYTVVDLAASWKPNGTLEFFGRVENLFDEDYEEVLGYGSMPLTATLGMKAVF